MIPKSLVLHQNDKRKAAKALSISKSAIYEKIKNTVWMIRFL
jgi:transcriptional regulator with PAS, ATPase and Fis domain